jgi:hypothetical protein
LTTIDIFALVEYLDHNGNLLLASPAAPEQLHNLDSAFMADYLHANLTGTQSRRYFRGVADHVVGGDLLYVTENEVQWDENTPLIDAANGGQQAFILTNLSGTNDYGSCGVTYDGSNRTIFLSFGLEYLEDDYFSLGYAPKDSLLMRALTFFVRGTATAVDDDFSANSLPYEFTLDQNYPNPFNPGTIITFSVAANSGQNVNLSVFNVLGQKVATLVDEVKGPGSYTVNWNGEADTGAKVASGVYFYRLTQGETSETRKMVLMK